MLKVIQLEERIVLDAAAVIDVVEQVSADTSTDSVDTSESPEVIVAGEPSEAVADVLALLDEQPTEQTQLILLSNGLDDYQALADDLRAAGAEVLIYDAELDSINDIVNRVSDLAIENGEDFGSLILLSHGSEGQFNLGNETLTSENVGNYTDQFDTLNSALADGGQFIIYGCNVLGEDGTGQALIDQLAELTDADVFASDDISGNLGDWVLEGSSAGVDPTSAEVSVDVLTTLQAYEGNLVAIPIIDLNPDGSANPQDATELPPAGFDYVTTFVEGTAAVVLVDTDIIITDTDVGATLTSSVLSITDGGEGDTFLVNGSTALAGTIGALTYTISYITIPPSTFPTILLVSISGVGTHADYQAALQTITYQNTLENPTVGDRTVNVSVTDNESLTSVAGLTRLHVVGVNDAPVNTLGSIAESVDEDTTLTFNAANGNGMSIADVDATVVGVNDPMLITLTVTNGTLNLGTTTGLLNLVGNGTATVTFEGSIAEVNAALEGLTYQGTANFNGTDTLTIVTNDQGNTGTGGALSDTDTVTITVNPINDAPIATVPATQTVDEDVALVFNAANANVISIVDIDANENGVADPMSVTISVTNGTLTLNPAATAVLGAVVGDGTASVTLTGTVTEINAALDGLVYTGVLNFNGADTFNITVNDNANSGAVIGVPLTDTGTFGITVNAVNDGPINTVPSTNIDPLLGAIVTQNVLEETPLTFSVANANALSIADVDAVESGAADPMLVTLTVANGTLQVINSAGLITFTGNNTGTIVLEGSVAEINAALEGLIYQGNLNYNGAEVLTILTSDQGNTGSGGALTDTDIVNILVNPVNDAPINTVPVAQTVNEDTALAFSAANGIALSIVDVDAGESGVADPMSITLSVNNGTLTLGTVVGLTNVTNNGTGTVTFLGTVAEVNTALDSLVYQGNLNYNGADLLTITTSDLGNTGVDANTGLNVVLSDTDTVAITVAAINDAPVNTVPPTNIDPLLGPIVTQDVLEDQPLTFNIANANLISVSDVDAVDGGATDPLIVTLTVTQGTITLSQTTGLTNVTGDGTATISVTGTAVEINAALNGLVYQGNLNYNGAETLTIVTNDQGNTGAGGAQTDTDVVNILVNPVNDPPINTVPAAQFTNEGTNIVFNTANGNVISIADLDAGESGVADPMQVTVSVVNGTLTLGGTVGLTNVVGNGMASITFDGSIAEINTALQGLTYSLVGPGTDVLTILTSDQGNTGVGGALTDTDTVAITINDIPNIDLNPPDGVVSNDNAVTFKEDSVAAVNVTDPTASVIDTNDTSFPTFTITAGNIQDGNNEIIGINGTLIPLGSDQTSNITVGGTTFTVVYTAATGLLTFSNAVGGEMPKADIQALIRTITYENTSQIPTVGAGTDRTLTFNLSDGDANSNSAVATITVDAVPDPVADAGSTFIGGTIVATSVFVNDNDPGDAPATFVNANGIVSVAGAPIVFTTVLGNGAVTFNTDGTYTYVSDGSFIGVDAFNYTIVDANGDTGTATVSITVTPLTAASAAGPSTATDKVVVDKTKVTGVADDDEATAEKTDVDTSTVPEKSTVGSGLGFGGGAVG